MGGEDDVRTERREIGKRTVQRLRVTVVSGPNAGAVFEPGDAMAIAVGTSADNPIVLTDPTVSRYHLELLRTDDGIGVTDLGSSNGTFVGAVRIERAIVPPGARLTLGSTVLELEDGNTVEQPALPAAAAIPGIVGKSEIVRRLMGEVQRLARANASVLIQGETGTGKEVFARALHDLSPRRDRDFVVVDCGSMPATLIASELFGHERGAFTGADERRAGAFERANGGTIMLDEIGELPIAVQPALLGVLERRRFRRLGGDKEIGIDVRIVAATHRDLRAEVNRGNFRGDLYFRLAVARMYLPPLRERPEDIPELVAHFVREVTGDSDMSAFGAATMNALVAHPWGGNVRELRNVVENALAMGRLSLEGTEPVAEAMKAPAAAHVREFAPYREARTRAITEFEREYLGALIEECKGNASEAARRAKMDRPFLLQLLRKHALRDPK